MIMKGTDVVVRQRLFILAWYGRFFGFRRESLLLVQDHKFFPRVGPNLCFLRAVEHFY